MSDRRRQRWLIGDEFIINPTEAQRAESRMHLSVAGTFDAIMMVEAGAKEVPEEQMLDASCSATKRSSASSP